jgi:hypothetical protein
MTPNMIQAMTDMQQPSSAALQVKRALGPAENKDDQSNDENETEYAATNIHVNLRGTE